MILLSLCGVPALADVGDDDHMNRHYVAIEYKNNHWFLLHKTITTPSFLKRRCRTDRYTCIDYQSMRVKCTYLTNQKPEGYAYVCGKIREYNLRIYTVFYKVQTS